jgi:hypothetical protein
MTPKSAWLDQRSDAECAHTCPARIDSLNRVLCGVFVRFISGARNSPLRRAPSLGLHAAPSCTNAHCIAYAVRVKRIRKSQRYGQKIVRFWRTRRAQPPPCECRGATRISFVRGQNQFTDTMSLMPPPGDSLLRATSPTERVCPRIFDF